MATADDADKQWRHLARSPVAWLDTAMTLRESALTIGRLFIDDLQRRLPPGGSETTHGVQPISFGPIFQMLAGYAIEALVKGIIVAKTDVIDGKYLSKEFRSHDFDKLLQLAGVTFAESHMTFIRRLGDAVPWVGRYPVSSGAAAMQPWKRSSARDLPMFDAIYDRLVAALQSAMRERPG
jgi:hypothetical protein